MSLIPTPPVPRELVAIHRTVRELCSEDLRQQCDVEAARAGPCSIDQRRMGRHQRWRRLWRRMRCAHRHSRDVGRALALAAAVPDSCQDDLDSALLHLLRASIEDHRQRCLSGDIRVDVGRL